VMSIAASAIDMLGTTQLHFMVALLLVGVGWNFMYVSGTTFIAGSYSRHERARVQASGELLTMSGAAVGALSAGVLLSELGWTRINALVLVPLLVCTGLVVHYTRASRRQRTNDEKTSDR
jgi:MFS family permease